MSTTLTTNQITIVDLTDTTTYFYYASGVDENGAGISPTINPTETTTHIGLYSGKPISSGQPDPDGDADNIKDYNKIKEEIVWSEYKGQPGETPVFDKTDKWYFLSDKPKDSYTIDELKDLTWGKLNVIPDIEGSSSARYLLIRNQDHWKIGNETQDSEYYYDQSYIGADGADANVYEIVTNPEEIIRFLEKKKDAEGEEINKEYSVVFNQNNFNIYVYKTEGDFRSLQDLKTEGTDNFDIYLEFNGEILKINELIIDENLSNFFKISEDKKSYSFDIGRIIKNEENIPTTEMIQEEGVNEQGEIIIISRPKDTTFGKIKNFFENFSNTIIGIKLFKAGENNNTDNNTDKTLNKKNILIRNNSSEDMAKFNLFSNSIIMAIENAGLRFDNEGLTLSESSFRMEDDKGDIVFGIDKISSNLTLKGDIYASNGYFGGTIQSESGYFNGEINAAGGTIGGFTIVNNEEGNYLLSSNEENDNIIKLDGKNGEIIADKISLGTGATITEYIKLGENSFIRNPSATENEDSIFIESGNIKIYDSGIIEAGNIKIDGNDSIITIGDSIDEGLIELDGANKILKSDSWKITPDKAIFNNITARGSLQATTFEYGKVQTVGGILFVKASSSIRDVNDNNIILVECNDNNLFEVGDICCFSEALGMTTINDSYLWKIDNIDEDDKTKLTLISLEEGKTIGKNLIGTPFFKLAKTFKENEEEKIKDNFAIGINSTSVSSFIPEQSISLNELIKSNKEDSSYEFKPKLILGKLDNIGYENEYGLYADNVYLNGRLVSQIENEKGNKIFAAGINSNGQGIMPYDEKDTNYPWHPLNKDKYGDNYVPVGNIVLWAGSNSENLNDASDARFIVDDNGNLYASSGYFKGAIITDSIIQASEIKTLTISGTGTGSPSEYGLTLKDVSKGIRFIDSNEITEINYFELTSGEFKTDRLAVEFKTSKNTFHLQEDMLSFDGTTKLGNIKIKDSFIGLTKGIQFDSNKFSIYDEVLKYDNGLKTNQTFSFSNKLYFNASSDKTYMESYNIIENDKSVTKGYDLYIME